jgi:hypothetical protein
LRDEAPDGHDRIGSPGADAARVSRRKAGTQSKQGYHAEGHCAPCCLCRRTPTGRPDLPCLPGRRTSWSPPGPRLDRWRTSPSHARVARIPRWSGVRATESYDFGTSGRTLCGPGLAMEVRSPGKAPPALTRAAS